MNEDDAARNAVEKMKLAALQGIPGEPIGSPEPPPHEEDAEIQLPPHRRILTTRGEVEELPRTAKKIPTALLTKIAFAISTGADSDEAPVTKGEVRAVFTQMAHLNQDIEKCQRALDVCRSVLEDIKAGGARQHQVIDAIAAIKTARQ